MIEIESESSPEAILERVREVLPTPWEWHMGGAHARTPFYGKVKANGFWIMKKKNRFERNSFNPELVAWVRPSQQGTRITAKTRIPLPVQVFLAIWCIAAVIVGGSGFYQSVTSEVASDREIAPVFALAVSFLLLIAGIIFVVARSVNQRRQPELEAWLRNIVAEGKAPLPRID